MAAESKFRADIRDDLVDLRGGGLVVVFRKTGDRWIEAIQGVGPAAELVRALALEAADPARVANPVYQEVQLHGATTRPPLCLLSTGLSFDHHFSAAVTLSADPEALSTIRLDFDVADRCRSPVDSLAATYLVSLDSGALESADTGRIVWQVSSSDRGRLELVAGPGASLTMAEAGRSATRVQILATIQPGTFTHRLRYGWRWTRTGTLTR